MSFNDPGYTELCVARVCFFGACIDDRLYPYISLRILCPNNSKSQPIGSQNAYAKVKAINLTDRVAAIKIFKNAEKDNNTYASFLM
jgi:hypothetical protein